jgi:hypothetical protein
MTPTEFAAICDVSLKMWRTTLRGSVRDFDEYRSRVLEAAVFNAGGETIRALCMSALRDMRRELERDAEVRAHLAFEAQRPATHDALPADFVVPHRTWGGRRDGAGRPKKKQAA